MPLEQTTEGLQIQSLEEIKSDLEAAFRDPTDGFGPGINLRPNSPFGQVIGIFAEREALIQQLAQTIQTRFDPNESDGVDLDVICDLTGTTRNPATQSKSSSGEATGTNGTVITDGSRVQNTDTGDIWEISGGPYTIPAGGSIAVEITAQETGPVEFLAASNWTILDAISGWSGFSTTADIDPEDTGSNIESDAELIERRRDELFSGGNDLSAIKAEVTKFVDEVSVYENRDCGNTSPDGIPPGAFETVVEGGIDQEIAEAIYSRKPPGAEAYGSTIVSVDDVEGNPISIGFTRVSDVDIWVDVIVGVGNAEAAMPSNVVTLIEDAILDFGNSNARIGQDVIPETFMAPIFEVLKDPDTGLYAAETLDIQVGTTASTSTSPIAISLRQRADYDSTRVTIAIP